MVQPPIGARTVHKEERNNMLSDSETILRIRVNSFTDFTSDIAAMARKNVALLDGTDAAIKRLVEAGEIVIALWGTRADNGRIIKGRKLLRKLFHSDRKYCTNISVIPCKHGGEAIAIRQKFGAPDDEDDDDEKQKHHDNHLEFPDMPLWSWTLSWRWPKPDTPTMTHWMSFADAKGFYGVACVDGDNEICVVNMLREVAKLGCIVPPLHHSEVLMQRLPPDLIPERYKNRLLNRDETKRLLMVKH
jgi:hypothetical protein